MSASHKGKKRGPLPLETRQKISESLKGKHQSEGTRQKRSESLRAYWAILTPEQRKERGDSQRGMKRSPEGCRNISESLKGREISPEHRRKISETLKGNVPSAETCRKISEANTGQKRTPEQRQRMRDSWTPERRERFIQGVSTPKSPEHRRKIGDANRGKKRTAEQCQRTSEISKAQWENYTPEEKEEELARLAQISRLNGKPSSLELALRAELDARSIAYEPHYPLLRYTIDIAFPDSRLAVEADGEYWHSRPSCIAKDERRDSDLEEEGWHTLRFLGSEIRADAAGCADRIERALM